MDEAGRTRARKGEHIDWSLDEVSAFRSRSNGLERYALVHDALPEVDFERIDLSTSFLGRALRLPLLVGSMTGGTGRAGELNRRLAAAAARAGCAMAVGSQRAALLDPRVADTFRVRDVAPGLLLFGNLGAVQLNAGWGLDECVRAVEMIGADGLFLHLNSLQEALQPEGDRDFAGLRERIAEICAQAPFPVLLKTVGNGLGRRTARKLIGLPLAGLEVSGTGGTSWARIEALRAGDAEALERFGEWGEDTAASLAAARAELPDLPLIASGGIADGTEVARALALGADLVGLARPLLAAAEAGEAALDGVFGRLERELRISCFFCGRERVTELGPGDLRPVGNPPSPAV